MTKISRLLGDVIVLHVPHGGNFVAAMEEHMDALEKVDLVLRLASDNLCSGGPT